MKLSVVKRRSVWVTIVVITLLLLTSPVISHQTLNLSSSNISQSASPTPDANLNGFTDNVNLGVSQSNTTSNPTSVSDGASNAITGGSVATTASTTTNDSSSASSSTDSSTAITVSPLAASSGVQAYSNAACSTSIGNINWGTIAPGGTVTKIVYIKNTGNTNSIKLSLQASSWSPTSASQYLTLSWNKQNTLLAPGKSTQATITLSVSSSVSGITSFSVQISVFGSS